MRVTVTNEQRDVPVQTARMSRLARRAVRRLRMRAPGVIAITFIGARQMRRINQRFRRHDWATDVLSFRYPPGPSWRGALPIIGDILIAPRLARALHHQLVGTGRAR